MSTVSDRRPSDATPQSAISGITYGVLVVLGIAAYCLLVLGFSLAAGEAVSATNPVVMGLMVAVIALVVLPLRARVQARIDALYARANPARSAESPTNLPTDSPVDSPVDLPVRATLPDRTVEPVSAPVAAVDTPEAIATAYQGRLEQALGAPAIVFLKTMPTGEFAEPGAATDVRFAADSPLVAALTREPVIELPPDQAWPPDMVAEAPRLRILNARLLAGLRGSAGLNGLIVLGPPRSEANGGAAYGPEALAVVEATAAQMNAAVERAQAVVALEQRVRELDVLSQISQAVNFTSDYDDLLELIATQADRLIGAESFYIVLRDEATDELYYAFFMENGERYGANENRRWPFKDSGGNDLYSEVIRRSQPIMLADVGEAGAERAPLTRDDSRPQAWIGVPLIVGQRTMGVLAAGRNSFNQPGSTYTADHLKSLNDVAALAATALDKMRLFDETNRRARQLAVLNDISRQVVAYESDLEKLLLLITAQAAEILNAESGLLLLANDDNTALDYRVVTGQADPALMGTQLRWGRGLAGRVAASGERMLINDASSLNDVTGELHPLSSRNVLAVPLMTSNRVIGVLEVQNKREGGFGADDADLLTTFGGQAAVAIENARLFQLTDFQLSQRVAELEALERIDVELNRSLDLAHVAGITVRYAMENSGATAGLLALVKPESNGLRVVTAQGYDSLPVDAATGLLPVDAGIMGRVLRIKRADLTTDVQADRDYMPTLPGSLSQITVPMLSGGVVNAVLVLETDREPRFSLVHMAFVQRLAEHASIAIANAQLYSELDRANQSKSEFVSFVAHELKNPLTSIRGYADLLSAGAVGPLSEQQKMFMGTIRSNAERMNTLVSDLNDVTKLQTNNMSIDPKPVHFSRIVDETARPLHKQIEDKQQELVINVPDDLPAVLGDETRLIQVLTNLLSNAHKYSPSGGTITIAARVTHHPDDANPSSKGQPRGPMVEASVTDTGIGMSEEDVAKLFTPYFRSDNPLAREQPGTGLGLTITRGLIERHGGEIGVESEVGQGTRFWFTVPVAG